MKLNKNILMVIAKVNQILKQHRTALSLKFRNHFLFHLNEGHFEKTREKGKEREGSSALKTC